VTQIDGPFTHIFNQIKGIILGEPGLSGTTYIVIIYTLHIFQSEYAIDEMPVFTDK
jgi:muramoyltetrapeptide carboxypeptidase LdcA involved in peptidoglycan recycling